MGGDVLRSEGHGRHPSPDGQYSESGGSAGKKRSSPPRTAAPGCLLMLRPASLRCLLLKRQYKAVVEVDRFHSIGPDAKRPATGPAHERTLPTGLYAVAVDRALAALR